MRIFEAVAIILFGVNTAVAQCECDELPYVEYELSSAVEFYGNPWRVIEVSPETDLRGVDQDRCFVTLELVDITDPILNEPSLGIPEDDYEIYFTGSWMLLSEVERVLTDTACLSMM